jgi:hypothetical protein
MERAFFRHNLNPVVGVQQFFQTCTVCPSVLRRSVQQRIFNLALRTTDSSTIHSTTTNSNKLQLVLNILSIVLQ